jgi:hypothetical protein
VNAETTAYRVLVWARDPVPVIPAGPLSEALALARPGPATRAALAVLLRDGAARLGLGNPVLGDRSPAGPGALLLAAAVGGRRQPDRAQRLAVAIRPPRPEADSRWADALARHLVVQPLVSRVEDGQPSRATEEKRAIEEKEEGEPLPELLLAASPLTGVLHRPARSRAKIGATAEVAAAVALLSTGRGRVMLTRSLADWSPDPRVLAWRTDLLGRLIAEHRDAVLDCYLNARTLYREVWDERLEEAYRALARPRVPPELALETARYWAPLARLRAHEPELFRRHPYLEGSQPALALVGRYRLGLGSAA